MCLRRPVGRRLGVALVAVLGLVLPAGPAPAAAVPQAGPSDDAPAAWRPPLDGALRVVRGFAPPARRWQPGHRGVDLAAPAGAVVRAAGEGTVTYAGDLAGTGVVAVTHPDGTRTTYQPVVAAVATGDAVAGGAVLGRLSPAGGHCLPATCLHWGRLRGAVYLDPLLLVRPGPVRLLPVWDAAAAAARVGPARRLDRAAAPAGSTSGAPPLRGAPVAAESAVRGPVGVALLLVLATALLLRPRGPVRRQSSAGSSTASRA